MRTLRLNLSVLFVSVLFIGTITYRAQAWRGAASGCAGDALDTPQYGSESNVRQQQVGIAAKLKPGPDYRAYSEEDAAEDSYKQRSKYQQNQPPRLKAREPYGGQADNLDDTYKGSNQYQYQESQYGDLDKQYLGASDAPHDENSRYPSSAEERRYADDLKPGYKQQDSYQPDERTYRPYEQRPDTPQYAQEQRPPYGQPPTYAQPRYGQGPRQEYDSPPAYEPPRYAQEQPYDKPAANPKPYKPAYNQEQQLPYTEPPAYPKPADKPAYGQEQYQPGYDKPSAYEKPYDTPSHGKADYQPGYDKPSYRQEPQQPYDQPPAYDKSQGQEEYQPYAPPAYSKDDLGAQDSYSKDSYSPKDSDKQDSYDPKDPYYPADSYDPKDSYGPKNSYDGPKDSYGPEDSYAPKDAPYGKDAYGKDATGPIDWYGEGADEPHGSGKDGSYGPQDSYGRNSYGRDSYSGYGAEGDKDSYGEVVSHICLQEQTGRAIWPEGQFNPQKPQYKSTFQCCSPDDAPDACLAGNNTGSPYSYYLKYPSFRSDSLLDTYLTPPTAATCFWSYRSTLCPPHLMDTCLGSGTLNCSLSGSAARSCGSPMKNFQFTASGYFIGSQALSCKASYGPVAIGSQRNQNGAAGASSTGSNEEGLFEDIAWVFRGQIKIVKRDYGYQEAKGTVEFVAAFGETPQGGDGGRRRRHLLADGATAPPAVPAAGQSAQGAAQATPATAQSAQGAAPATAQGAAAVAPKKRAKASSWGYADYASDLPIVQGGSLHIRLFDKWDDRGSDGYGY